MNDIIKDTKNGRYVNVACKENYTNVNWIPLASVIGLGQWRETGTYFARVSFMLGHGINGVDNELKVTKEIYDILASELGLA